MILIMLVAIHVLLLHENNSTGMFRMITKDYDRMNMLSVLGWRDITVGSLIVIGLLWNVQTLVMMDEENNNAGNSLVTPHEIRPEFYFMPLYGVLRSIPIKWLGVVMMALFLISMLIIQNSLTTTILNKNSKNRSWLKILEIVLIGYVCGKVNSTYKIYLLFTLVMAAIAISL